MVYGLRSTELPRLSAASCPPYAAPGSLGAGSIHGFVLGEWVEVHGPKAYLHMLESVAELVNNGQLSLDGEADLLPCGTTPSADTAAAGGADAAAASSGLPARFKAPIVAQKTGTVVSIEPQPVLTGDEMVRRGLIPSYQQDNNTAGETEVDGGTNGMVPERIAAAVSKAVRGVGAHEVQETGGWAERRKVVLSFGTAEEAADEAVELGRAITELAQTLEWHGTKPYRPGEGPRNLWIRSIFADAWTKVSVLNEWRVDGCILVATIVGDVEDDEIDLLTWRAVVDPGPQRSRRCWDSFVQHYHPDLAGLLAEI